MGEVTTCTVITAVVVGVVVLFLANLSIVTHSSKELQFALEDIKAEMDSYREPAIHTELLSLKEKLSSMHGSQENLKGGMKTIDDLVALIKKKNDSKSEEDPQNIAQSYSRSEMEHIGVLLDELKSGFTQYKEASDKNEHEIMNAVAGVATSMKEWKEAAQVVGHSSEMGSMHSEESMQHHANVAVIRRDLPMVLPTVRLLIGILSGPKNIDRRNEVRQTWVKEYRKSLGLSRQWSMWFLVSAPKDDEEAKQIREESEEYGDIMLMSYLTEDYHLIGAKVVEFFHAASLFPQLQFVMKGDDDTFVRIDRLLAQLDEHRDGNLFLGCSMGRSPPIRAKNNKRYYVAPEEFSADAFPKYCSGGGYVLSMDVVRAFDYVGQAAGYEPFKFEDVNTGMLIDIAGLKVTPKQGKGFYCWGPPKHSTEISQLQKDWVVYHYVGGKKKWTMAKLLEGVQSQPYVTIFQKKLKIEVSSPIPKWTVKEIELYKGSDCASGGSLAKAFGIGTLAKKREEPRPTTWQNTFFEASSNKDDAHLAFDGKMDTAWTSDEKETKHSISLMYGIHSVPFADIGCMKVFQETSDGKSPDLNIYFWDDDDAKWHLVVENLSKKFGTDEKYVLSFL